MFDLFEEKSWIGEFFTPDDYENRFTGEIYYSSTNQVVLSYLMPMGKPKPKESKIVYGVLSTGDKCTLVGQFSPKNTRLPELKNGLMFNRCNVGFSCLLIGDFLTEDEPIFDISFSLTHLQEFFFLKEWKNSVRYSDELLFSISTDYGKINIGNVATFDSLNHDDFFGLIYNKNKDALTELQNSFTQICEKYPNDFFKLKENIAYRIQLKIDKSASISNAYQHIMDITDLFALLLYSPVYPDNIQINKIIDNDLPITIKVYPSIFVNPASKTICLKDKSHFRLPITNEKVELPTIIPKWLELKEQYVTIISSIQNQTEYRTPHSLHGEIVVYATQLEDIATKDDAPKKKKYEYSLKTYGSQKIKNGIDAIFKKKGFDDVGVAIATLRNNIAHTDNDKKLLNSLSWDELTDISDYLQLTVIGYILKKMEMNEDVISNYQNYFA